MARVGTCQDCSARYKIPDSFSGSRARCKKCGGTVAIAAADAAEPGAGAPKAGKAPAKKRAPAPKVKRGAARAAKTVAPTATGGRLSGAPTKKAAAAPTRGKVKRRSAARAGGRAGGRRRGARGRGARDETSKSSPLVPVLIVLVIVLGGGAGWWFLAGPGAGDEAATADAGGDEAPAAGDAGPASREDAATTDASAAAPDEGAPDDVPPDEVAPVDAAAAPAAPAPTKIAEKKRDSLEDLDLDPVLDFEPVPPLEGTTQEQLDEWTALVRSYFLEDPSPRTAKRLRTQLEQLDIVDATPAFLNAIRGVDISKPLQIRNVWRLVEHWQEEQGGVLKFYFEGETSRDSKVDRNKRIIAIVGRGDEPGGWLGWWLGKKDDPQKIEKYRLDVAEGKATMKADEG